MVSSIERPALQQARVACFSCRKGKRRCDRALPACRLCVSKDIDCSYPTHRGQKEDRPGSRSTTPTLGSASSTSTSPSQHQHQHHCSATLSISSSAAAALFFIAPDAFRQAQLELPRSVFPVPNAVAAIVGDTARIREVATGYFAIANRWMPVISRKRFFSNLLHPLSQRQCELSLLVLCMELYCTALPEGVEDAATDLYRLAKGFHRDLEGAGIMSIHVLQAGILLAMYEIAQAVYPAAYLSVGACARYGAAMGLDKLMGDLLDDTDPQSSWIEVEERRRVWWAILMLDRFANIGNPGRCTAVTDPAFDNYLPVDDELFDEGTTKPGDAVNISTGFTLKMGLFSRQSQATYLLGQTLKVISTQNASGGGCNSDSVDETAQLRRTLQALVNLTEKEATIRRLEFCSPSALSYTSILLLQQHDWLKKSEDDRPRTAPRDLFPETRLAVEALSKTAVSCERDLALTPDLGSHLSFLLLQAMYQAGLTLVLMSGGHLDGALQMSISAIKDRLRDLKPRWRLAGIYLNILEAKENTVAWTASQLQQTMVQSR